MNPNKEIATNTFRDVKNQKKKKKNNKNVKKIIEINHQTQKSAYRF